MTCLLCKRSQVSPVWRITGEELRKLLHAANHQVSDDALGKITPGYEIELIECGHCGFQFFDPSLAGSARFYEELDQQVYYPATRPEFDFALDFAKRNRAARILDIGGGAGAFLDRAKAQGLQTFGLELNSKAASAAASKGHQMVQKSLEEVDPEEFDSGVDVITLFQVVEHVPDPAGFVREAAKLLKRDGAMIISVPNRDGLFRLLPYDAANLPPHHISRWRRQDLDQLGRATNMCLINAGADTLYGSALHAFWLLHNQLSVTIGRQPYPGGKWLPALISQLYRKLGCRFFFPRWGLSLYGVFKKSGPAER